MKSPHNGDITATKEKKRKKELDTTVETVRIKERGFLA